MDQETDNYEAVLDQVVRRFRHLPNTGVRLQATAAVVQGMLLRDRTDPNLQLFADLIDMILEEYDNEQGQAGMVTTSDLSPDVWRPKE